MVKVRKHLCLLMRVYAPTTSVCEINAKNCATKNLYSYLTINGNVKYTLREGGEVCTVTHKNNLTKIFPNAYCE